VYALVKSQTVAIGTCPLFSPYLSDIVSNGALDGSSPVTCYPGTDSAHYVPAKYYGTATSVNGLVYPYAAVRGNPCGNTFDESIDWQVGYIDFENSATTPRPCPAGQPLLVAATTTPSSFGLTDSFKVVAKLTPASNSSSDMVTADLSVLGLSSAVTLADDGTGTNTYVSATQTAQSTSGFPIGPTGVVIPSITVTATDTANNRAQTSALATVTPGTLTLTSAKSSITVKSGGSAIFPMTVKGSHGYQGIVEITCTGSPNTNSLGVPVTMQCVTTPPEISLSLNGSANFQLAISAGTTYSAGMMSRSFYGIVIALLSILVLSAGIWRRKHLPAALAFAFLALATLGSTGCETNAGLKNTGTTPGTYTFVVTAVDTTLNSVVQNSTTVQVVVQ